METRDIREISTKDLLNFLQMHTDLFYLPYVENLDVREEMYELRLKIIDELRKRFVNEF